jgi:hypothetical protein
MQDGGWIYGWMGFGGPAAQMQAVVVEYITLLTFLDCSQDQPKPSVFWRLVLAIC